MSETKLSMEPSFPLVANCSISKVVVIGCGGTGSYYIRDLARLVGSMKTKPEIVLIDGDTVEEKNLIRQNFVSVDIGRNKAEVQAGRYAGLGAQMAFKSEYLSSKSQLHEIVKNNYSGVLIVSCVDNIKTRLLIREALAEKPAGQTFWIDCGNEEETGQVVISVKASSWDLETMKVGLYPTPDVFDLYPELLERAKTDKLPTEMNCAEMAVASPQFGFVNGTAAMIAVNFTHRLLSRGQVKVNETCFSIDNRFSHRSLTLSTIKEWAKNFAPMATTDLDSIKKK